MTKRSAKPSTPKAQPAPKATAPQAPQPVLYNFQFDASTVRVMIAGLDKLPGEVSRPFVNFLEQDCARQDAGRNAPKAPTPTQAPAPAPTKTPTPPKA
jgi:hypothetical protein